LPFKGSRFFPSIDLRLGIVLLVILSLARSLIQWGGQLSSVALNSTFLFRIRTRLLEWMFRRQTLLVSHRAQVIRAGEARLDLPLRA
jgi:hypothetical protein